MSRTLVVRRALMTDAPGVDNLLSEWFDWKPISGRLNSVQRAVRKKELLVAKASSRVVGFIHYVLHEDIIDGGPNAFISAFYVSEAERGKGSTIHMRAKQFYEKHHFEQTMGDISEVFLELDIAEYSQAKKGVDPARH